MDDQSILERIDELVQEEHSLQEREEGDAVHGEALDADRARLEAVSVELDRNVDPASTMQVVNALIKASKEFDFLLVPGAGHGVARTTYGWKKLEDFFARELLN